MLAAVHALPLNASQLGNALGLDAKTLVSYTDFLEGAFLVRRLPAYFANIKKRLVKSPRMYIRDSGLLHALLRVRDRDDLFVQTWVEQSWEGFVVEQTLAALRLSRRDAEAFYFRSSDGYEADLVLQWGARRWAIEVKLTSNPSADMANRLRKTAGFIQAEKAVLICRTVTPYQHEDLVVTNPVDWLQSLREV